MHKSALFLLVAVLLLAGCSSPAPASQTSATSGVQYQDSVLQLSQPTMPRDAPLAGERNLTAPPQWRLGEYWKYHMQDQFTGHSSDFLRVVAGEDNAAGNYLVGFPKDEFDNDVMVLHIPGYGDITKEDLSYETHDK